MLFCKKVWITFENVNIKMQNHRLKMTKLKKFQEKKMSHNIEYYQFVKRNLEMTKICTKKCKVLENKLDDHLNEKDSKCLGSPKEYFFFLIKTVLCLIFFSILCLALDQL